MRILFLSNFYPPARPGGYTQWCHEVAECLKERGHHIGVLTSRHQREQAPSDERDIFRVLHLEGDLNFYRPLRFFMSWKKQYLENLAEAERVIKDFAPDIVFVWGMWAMSKAIPAVAERLIPSRVVYYLSDYWASTVDMHTTYWQTPHRRIWMRPFKRALGAIAKARLNQLDHADLKFKHVICVSRAVRDILIGEGVAIEHARVIHGGTDVDKFSGNGERPNHSDDLKLLYAGQLVQHKGVHTAIAAVGELVNEFKMENIHLTLVGSGHPSYEDYLRDLVADLELDPYVTFRGAVAREDMAATLQEFGVLIFPSIYEEPLARMTQEAMAAGLVVIGTETGGTREILQNGENGLTFPAEDARALARQVSRLKKDPALGLRLAHAGRQTVMDRFTLDRMALEIETYLEQVANNQLIAGRQ